MFFDIVYKNNNKSICRTKCVEFDIKNHSININN
jgi:hypothetical protein